MNGELGCKTFNFTTTNAILAKLLTIINLNDNFNKTNVLYKPKASSMSQNFVFWLLISRNFYKSLYKWKRIWGDNS